MDITKPLLEILGEAVAVGRTVYGTIQIYDKSLHHFHLVAHYGFDPTSQVFHFVQPGGTSATARAFALGKRVIVADVKRDPFYLPYLAIAEQLGYQAVQATPLLVKDDQPLGVLTTNFATVYYPTRAETNIWDRCAERATRLIQSFRIYHALD